MEWINKNCDSWWCRPLNKWLKKNKCNPMSHNFGVPKNTFPDLLGAQTLQRFCCCVHTNKWAEWTKLVAKKNSGVADIVFIYTFPITSRIVNAMVLRMKLCPWLCIGSYSIPWYHYLRWKWRTGLSVTRLSVTAKICPQWHLAMQTNQHVAVFFQCKDMAVSEQMKVQSPGGTWFFLFFYFFCAD